MLGRTLGPSPSFRQGPPESRHRDVNLNRPTDPKRASITPMAALSGVLNAALEGSLARFKPK
jgi:hypothetical protein